MNTLALINGGSPSLRQKVAAIIVEQIGKRIEEPRILDTSEFCSDLGFDSLDRFSIVSEVEEQFGIQFTSDEEERLVTVRDLLSLIERKLNVIIPAA